MRILAVDISSLFSRYWEVNQGGNREFSQPYLSTLHAVRRLRQEHDRVAICCDSGISWRRTIWPEYKANRTDRGEAYREQLCRTVEDLRKDGCLVFRAPAMQTEPQTFAEADDVIGSLVGWALDAGHAVTIASSDKDLLQLVCESVRMVNGDDKLYGPEDVRSKFAVEPARIPDLLALAGDDSDNYKPFPGIGMKTAAKLVAQCGSAIAVFSPEHLEHLHEYVGDSAAKKLRDGGRELATKCLTVATVVRDLPLPFEELEKEPMYESTHESEQSSVEQSTEPSRTTEQQETAIAVAKPTAAPPAAPKQESPSAMLLEDGTTDTMPYWAQPGYLDRLWRVAKAFKFAGCFPNVGKEEQVMVVAMMAHERGIGLATAMQHAYFVNGRLSWSGAYLALLARRSGQCEEMRVLKLDDHGCMIRLKRKGQAARDVPFSYAEAEASGVTNRNRSVWGPYRKQMLYWSCLRTGLRQEFPAEIAGHYMPDEVGEAPEEVLAKSVRMQKAA